MPLHRSIHHNLLSHIELLLRAGTSWAASKAIVKILAPTQSLSSNNVRVIGEKVVTAHCIQHRAAFESSLPFFFFSLTTKEAKQNNAKTKEFFLNNYSRSGS